MVSGGHMQPYDHPAKIAAAVVRLSGGAPQSPKAGVG
jgi:hypothetical protein